jgi:hypothetical protein
MKGTHVIGIAFATIFAFSLIGASGASALSLWDQCTKTANPLEFMENDCTTIGIAPAWGWEEIKPKTNIDSLITTLVLSSNGTTIDCEGSMEGAVGAGDEGEVLKLLSSAGEEITEAKPVTCPLLVAGICAAPVMFSPMNLPWLMVLTGLNVLLESGGTGNPGWLMKCANGIENLCTRTDTFLTVENLLSELEVDLGVKPLETATCILGTEAAIGTVSILLENGNALRAM